MTTPGLNFSLKESITSWLEQSFVRDSEFRPYSSLLGLNAASGVTVSGLSNVDYPRKDSCIGGQMKITKNLPIPYELIDKFTSMKESCLMGTFVPCSRVWVTIDNEFFMWDYDTSGDLVSFNQLTETIVCVGMANPPANFFPPKVKHLLVLSTVTQVIVLPMVHSQVNQFDDNAKPEYLIDLIPEALYRVSTDLLTINCIKATPEGRIFLGTRDGSILELVYKPINDWPVTSLADMPPSAAKCRDNASLGPCSLVNHSESSISFIVPYVIRAGFSNTDAIAEIVIDSSRHCLYTRTESGSQIVAYQYRDPAEPNHQTFFKIASVKGSHLCERAHNAITAVGRDQFKDIVSILPLVGYGDMLHLMAVTGSGIRLYLDGNLRLLHVRLPPTNVALAGNTALQTREDDRMSFFDMSHHNQQALGAASRMNFKIGQVRLVTHSRGTMICVCTNDNGSNLAANLDNSDGSLNDSEPCSFLCINPDPFPWCNCLAEYSSCVMPSQIELPRNVWALVPLDDNEDLFVEINDSQTPAMRPAAGDPNQSPDSLYSKSSQPSPRQASTRKIKAIPPAVLTQHLDPPMRRFLLVSAEGLLHLSIQSPLSHLRNYLATGMQQDNQTFLNNYMQQFGPDESIVAALCVAAQAASVKDVNLQRMAEQSAWYFAVNACNLWNPMVARTQNFMGLATSGGAVGRFANIMEIPTLQSDRVYNQIISSSLFLVTGTVLYMSRCLKSIWRQPLVQSDNLEKYNSLVKRNATGSSIPRFIYNLVAYAVGVKAKDALMDDAALAKQMFLCYLTPQDMTWLIDQLNFLLDFVTRNSAVDNLDAPLRPKVIANQQVNEIVANHLSVDAQLVGMLCEELQKLIKSSLEIVSFWNILNSASINEVVRLLTMDQQRMLLATPLEAFVQSINAVPTTANAKATLLMRFGYNEHSLQSPTRQTATSTSIASDLLELLVKAYIDYLLACSMTDASLKTTVDQFTQQLHIICPSLFTNDAALTAKAYECLLQAGRLLEHFLRHSAAGQVALDQLNLRSLASSTGALASNSQIAFTIMHSISGGVVKSLITMEMDKMHGQLLDLLQQAVTLFQQIAMSSVGHLNLQDSCQRLMQLGMPESWICAGRLSLLVAKLRDPQNLSMQCYKEGRRPSALPLVSAKLSELNVVEARYDAYHSLLDLLDRLLEMACLPKSATDWSVNENMIVASLQQDQQQQFKSKSSNLDGHNKLGWLNLCVARYSLECILADVFNEEADDAGDQLAQYEVMGWLLQQGLVDRLLSLPGQDLLESYLKSRLSVLAEAETQSDLTQLKLMLWRVLTKRNAHLEAAQVLESLALTNDLNSSLDERVSYLARAMVSLKSLENQSFDPDYLRSLQDRLETAELQQQVLQEMASQHPTGLDQAKQRLRQGPLLDLTHLFVEYAEPHRLYESKLSIIKAANHQDPELIQAVWLDLLKRVLQVDPETMGDVHDVSRELALCEMLRRRYYALGMQNLTESVLFPVDVLVTFLERYAIEHSLDVEWVPAMFQKADIQMPSQLTQQYDHLLRSKEAFWHEAKIRERLHRIVLVVTRQFVQHYAQFNQRLRKYHASQLLDLISAQIMDLQSSTAAVANRTMHRNSMLVELGRLRDHLEQI